MWLINAVLVLGSFAVSCGYQNWQEAPITRQLPEFDQQLPYLIQTGSAVHYTKLVYPNLCVKVAEQIHFQKSASTRTEKNHKPTARKAPSNHTVNLKLIRDRVYDLCMRKFRESAVEPIQNFCRAINSQVALPTGRILPLLIIPAAIGISLGVGVISGALITQGSLAKQKQEFEEQIKNVSLIINENQGRIADKLTDLEEQLKVYEATVITQAENHFLPQVVGEVFLTASELVKENIFHERILRYAPGALADSQKYDLRHVRFISCEELPIDDNLISINVTMVLPIVDRQVLIHERKWLPYSQGEWVVTAEGSPYQMTSGKQRCYVKLPAYHGSRLIDRPACLPSDQSFRRIRVKKLHEPPSAMISNDDVNLVWCKNGVIVIDSIWYSCPDFPFAVRRGHQVELKPPNDRNQTEYRSQSTGVVDFPVKTTALDNQIASFNTPELQDLPIKEPGTSTQNPFTPVGEFFEKTWQKIVQVMEGPAKLLMALGVALVAAAIVYWIGLKRDRRRRLKKHPSKLHLSRRRLTPPARRTDSRLQSNFSRFPI